MTVAELTPTAGLLRAVVATTATGGLTVALGRVTARLLADLSTAGTRGLEGGVALLAVAIGAVALGVVTVGCLLSSVGAAARLGGHTLARLDAAATLLTPALLRRAIAIGVSTGLLASVAGAATATEPDGWGTVSQTEAVAAEADVDLGWQVTSLPAHGAPAADPATTTVSDSAVADVEPVESPALTHGASASTTAEQTQDAPNTPNTPNTVTVRPGDTLWAIAAAHLPDGSGDADIAASWPRWYAANLAVIGDDPNLIRPGQVLTAPGEVHS